MIGYIYLWTNNINGKRYVGQTWNWKRRRNAYKRIETCSEESWNKIKNKQINEFDNQLDNLMDIFINNLSIS